MKPYDTLCVNADIRSLETETSRYRAMAIKNGRIVELFRDAPPPALALKASDLIDFGGRTILPAFIDCHAHFLASSVFSASALTVMSFDVCGLKRSSVSEVLERIRVYGEGLPMGMPVFCFSYILEGVAEGRLPHKGELDACLPGREVFVFSMDGHSSSYSTQALRRLGFLGLTSDGVLSGDSHELNMGRVNSYLSRSVSIAGLCRGIENTVNEAIASGLVCVHSLEGFDDEKRDPSLWFMSRVAGILPIDIRLYIQYRDTARLAPYLGFLRNRRVGGCFAWAFDGSVSSGTAAFTEAYADDPENRGKLYFTAEDACALLSRADEGGFQITAHAIGTQAIEVLLSAYERVLSDGTNPLRHRIDHFEFPTADQVKRAVRLSLPLVIQPGFAWMDEHFVACYKKRLTQAQYARQLPLRDVVDSGGRLACSSDSPAGPLNPWVHIQGMVDYTIPEQSLSLYQALRACTYDAAWTTGEEHERGTLEKGKQADFIVMEQDPFALRLSELYKARAAETYLRGGRLSSMKLSPASCITKMLFSRKKKI
jgi:predicted amidohydrolase YtcJ